MNLSMPGLPVHHQLPKLTQTHANRVGDAIQPSHPLSHPSPPAPNPSQHQGLFQWVNSLHEVAKVLEFQLQHQFFQLRLTTHKKFSSPQIVFHTSRVFLPNPLEYCHKQPRCSGRVELNRWTFVSELRNAERKTPMKTYIGSFLCFMDSIYSDRKPLSLTVDVLLKMMPYDIAEMRAEEMHNMI